MQKETWREIPRQAAHSVGIIAVLGTYVLPYKWMVVALLIAVLISATHMFLRPIAKKVPGVRQVSDFFMSLAREDEVEGGYFYGATSFFLGILLVLLIFQSMHIFRVAAVVLIFGDSVSTIVGKAFGKRKILFNKEKSIEGSLAGFAAAFLVFSIRLSIPLAALLAAVGMLVEALPLKLNDNITIPLAVGIFYWLILL